MSVIVYRYAYFRGRFVPLIPVGIRGAAQWHRVWAYADSGAAYSIFDDSVARLLGIDWRAGRHMVAATIAGTMIHFYLHLVTLQIRRVRVSMDIGFSAELRVGFNLLGLDLFDQFNQVIFDSRNRRMMFMRSSGV